ncbi:DUF1919 domain-containing protein [Nesterenkonia sp. YGD6]|uniref:DUF1919 domain-containing protein n=1 Tax=Nesterenkonia sp. YGD6 TaxID=2901231 RepID=UPI001F4CCA22|nr:DUF1919 domain-containing protein [Nesterenkonia sp. YGD6]MCH8563287.1 DUF1919 domain-containing protein [Nesterenkonia sp. YGD6]
MKKLKWETVRLAIRNRMQIPSVRRFFERNFMVTGSTIISRNCWSGTVYETYGLPKLSPTLGVFFMPGDYLQFKSDLDRRLATPMKFVKPRHSKSRSTLKNKGNSGSWLMARLGEVELHMLRQHDEKVARKKWESRVNRVNWQRLIIKFNDKNGATNDQLRQFDRLDLEHKITFTVRDSVDIKSAVNVPRPSSHAYGRASYGPASDRKFEVAKYENARFGPEK